MSDRYTDKARELRKEHQETCSLEQLTIRYGLRTAEEAQRLLDKRFDEKCAAALQAAADAERADCALYVAQQAAKITGHHPFDVEARELLIMTGDALRAGHRAKGKP